MKVRRRVLDCYILLVLMYDCEAWTISKEMENRFGATEMWFLSRMLKILYMDKNRNEEVLERAGTTRLQQKKDSFLKVVRKNFCQKRSSFILSSFQSFLSILIRYF